MRTNLVAVGRSSKIVATPIRRLDSVEAGFDKTAAGKLEVAGLAMEQLPDYRLQKELTKYHGPTTLPTATPPAVAAICPISPDPCLGAPTAECCWGMGAGCLGDGGGGEYRRSAIGRLIGLALRRDRGIADRITQTHLSNKIKKYKVA